MRWKIQVLNQETGIWEDIDKEECKNLGKWEAKDLANHMNNIKPNTYRAVES